MEFVLFGLVASLSLVLFVYLRESRRGRMRRALLASPLRAEWDAILLRNFPLYRRLPEPLRERLGGYVNAFVAEKTFEACGDLEAVTEEMQVTVAGQACLLLLNGRYGVFEELSSVLLYPDAFRVRPLPGYEEDLEMAEGGETRLGESWDTGSVVLSWRHVLHGPEYEEDGINVVLHEFAHQLDQHGGAADGVPVLRSRVEHREWAEVFRAAYARHCEVVERGARRGRRRGRRGAVIDAYGAENPAEFFAVATETFFEKPAELQGEYPDLYGQLREFFELDPLEW